MSEKNRIISGCGFHHLAIRVRDFDRSVRFYTDVLGCTEKIAWGDAPHRAVMLDLGDGNYLELFERPDQPPPAPEQEGLLLHLALRTDRVDEAIERVRAAGAQVTMEPKSVDIPTTNGLGPVPVRIAFFKGPDGEVIEFFQNELT